MATNKTFAGSICRKVICSLLALITLGQIPAAFAADVVTPKKLSSPPPPAMPPFVRRGSKSVQLHPAVLVFSKNPTDQEITAARIFPEPLIPMNGKKLPGENQALAKALLSFKSKSNSEETSDLARFIAQYPRSRWRASLELNLAEYRFETGYLTDALRYWKSAWELSKKEKGQAQTAVATKQSPICSCWKHASAE